MGTGKLTGARWLLCIPFALAGVVGLLLAVVALNDQIQLRRCIGDLGSRKARVRERALQYIAQTHEARAMPALVPVLETEQDRPMLGLAAYAALRTLDPMGVPSLQRRANEGPDDKVRANLIYYAARLSDRDLRLLDWLAAGAKSGEAWRRAGSAVGLLELGQPAAGLLLIELAGDPNADIRNFVLEHLRRTAGSVTEAIGQPIAWPKETGEPLDPAFLGNARSIWQRQVTVRVLNDVLNRLRYDDPDWFEIGRLLHARDRASRFLN